MKQIFIKASKAADKFRASLGLDIYEAIDIYSACERKGVDVRFVDLDMEGMYMATKNIKDSYIMLSNKRPMVRRVFTCGHEIGHHYFNHGSNIDTIEKSNIYDIDQRDEEFLVNTFAGYLLMPIAGLQAQFSKRNWNPYTAIPIQYYLISSYFGIGYHTLIYHCRANRIINFSKAEELLKFTPAKIFKNYFSESLQISHFKIFDRHLNNSSIELEVSNYILLPKFLKVTGEKLELILETKIGNLYIANNTGIVKIDSNIIKIQKRDYVGLAIHRHL